jgi:Na+/H+ antiporter NhaA
MGKKLFPNIFKDFLHAEQSSGVLLMICAVIALVISNSPINEEWFSIWKLK